MFFLVLICAIIVGAVFIVFESISTGNSAPLILLVAILAWLTTPRTIQFLILALSGIAINATLQNEFIWGGFCIASLITHRFYEKRYGRKLDLSQRYVTKVCIGLSVVCLICIGAPYVELFDIGRETAALLSFVALYLGINKLIDYQVEYDVAVLFIVLEFLDSLMSEEQITTDLILAFALGFTLWHIIPLLKNKEVQTQS